MRMLQAWAKLLVAVFRIAYLKVTNFDFYEIWGDYTEKDYWDYRSKDRRREDQII